MGASPKHKYYARLAFDKPVNGIGSFVSYSNDDLEMLIGTLRSEAKRFGVKCSAEIMMRDNGKLLTISKPKDEDLMV